MQELREMQHAGTVTSVEVDHTGTRLLSTSHDQTVCVWDLRTGEKLLRRNFSSYVQDGTWDPRGLEFATACASKQVAVWDAITGRRTTTLDLHTDWVERVRYSPDGRVLASVSDDRTVRLWDPRSRKCTGGLFEHESIVWCCCWVSDLVLASGGYDGMVYVWDIRCPSSLFDIDLNTSPWDTQVHALDCCPGTRTVVAGTSKRLFWLDSASGRAERAGEDFKVWSCCFSKDGLHLAAGGTQAFQACAKLLTADGREIASERLGDDSARGCTFVPDGSEVVFSHQPRISVWGPIDNSWSPRNHSRFRAGFRDAVRTVLLCQRRDDCPVGDLPSNVLHNVFSVMDNRSWPLF